MGVRLGEALVNQGMLTNEQVEQILDVQQNRARPFGVLAEEMFGVDPAAIESAWLDQLCTVSERVSLDGLNPTYDILDTLDRRQAWQFRVFPVRRDLSEVVLATTEKHLARAMRFAASGLSFPTYFVLTSPESLGSALERCYPIDGMHAGLMLQDLESPAV